MVLPAGRLPSAKHRHRGHQPAGQGVARFFPGLAWEYLLMMYKYEHVCVCVVGRGEVCSHALSDDSTIHGGVKLKPIMSTKWPAAVAILNITAAIAVRFLLSLFLTLACCHCSCSPPADRCTLAEQSCCLSWKMHCGAVVDGRMHRLYWPAHCAGHTSLCAVACSGPCLQSWSHAAKLLRTAAAAVASDRSIEGGTQSCGDQNGTEAVVAGNGGLTCTTSSSSKPAPFWASLVADISHPAWWPKTGHVPTYDIGELRLELAVGAIVCCDCHGTCQLTKGETSQ